LLEIAEEFDEAVLAEAIDAGGGLIEKKDVRPGREGAGDIGALEFTAGKRADWSFGKLLDANFSQKPMQVLQIIGGFFAENSDLAGESQADELADVDRETRRGPGILREIAQDISAPDGGSGGHSSDRDYAARRRQKTQEKFYEGRLAAAVGTDDTDGCAA